MRITKLLASVLAALMLASCTSAPETTDSPTPEGTATPEAMASPTPEGTAEPPASAEPIRVAALKGATAIGMVRLIEQNENGESAQDYEFTLGVIDEILPKVSQGAVDIAAVPANLAAVLHKNTDGAVRVAAINTLGVLYVVEKGESVLSVADLAGKTIYATGKGASPEFALNYVLEQNGLDPATDLTIEFRSEPAEVLPLLEQSDGGIALLPQPFVTNALKKVEGLRVALDLTEQWDNVSDGGGLVTGVLIVNADFAQNNPDAVEVFLEEYAASTRYANESVEETAALVASHGIVAAEIAVEAIPYCNITCITGVEMKTILSGYLDVLFRQNPASVGGELPGDAFYYGA